MLALAIRSTLRTCASNWNGAVSRERPFRDGRATCIPPDTVKSEFLKPSDTHTTCWWKGEASYYTLAVDGAENRDAAWFYPEPSDAAKNIEGYVAFWKGVTVES